MHELRKTPPYSLEDIYSFGLRRLSCGIPWREDDFVSLGEEMISLKLLHADPTFPIVFQMLRRKTRNAASREDKAVSARPFQSDLRDAKGKKIHLNRAEHCQIGIWLLTACRFSSAVGIALADLQITIFQQEPCLCVQVWQDKVMKQRGRRILLTCNCAPKNHPAKDNKEHEYCPICEFTKISKDLPKRELHETFSSNGWESLSSKMHQANHSLRRRWAIQLRKDRDTPKKEKELPLSIINNFVGWAERSRMFNCKYSRDWLQYKDENFEIYMGSVKKNIIYSALFAEQTKHNILISLPPEQDEVTTQLLYELEEDSDADHEWQA